MPTEQLLQELEVLTHKARIRRMVELGRTMSQDPEIAATLVALEQGEFYERFLALYSCFGSHDALHVMRALTDPSRIIRGVAINLVVLTCKEDQLHEALTVVPRDGRLSLLWKLHHHGYDTLIDDFLEHLVSTDDLQLQKLLPRGSSTLVHRFIARFQHRMELVDWRRLAHHHATIAFELLQARAEAATNFDLQLLSFVNSILPLLTDKQPDQALTLVETLARFVPLNRLDLRALILKRPAGVADLVLRGEDFEVIDLSCVAHRLDNARLLAWLEMYPNALEYAEAWISAMKPARRAALYPVIVQIWRNHGGRIPADVVALLPRALREQEGRRHLALFALATRAGERLPYAAFLPWDEARSILDPFLHDPTMQIRSVALATLVHVVHYERGRVASLLAILQTYLNESDPVRATILSSLGGLPRSVWHMDHLDAIEQIIDATVNAFDASAATSGLLVLLVLRLWECAPESSARQLASILQARGSTFNRGHIDDRLSDADVRYLGPVLQPVLQSWAENKNEKALQGALVLFGKRVRVFDELFDALEVIFKHGTTSQFGNLILASIIKYRPERAAQLIPELCQYIASPVIATYLHHHRQDLLTSFLSQRKYSKIFSKVDPTNRRRRGKGAIKPLTRGFACWTAHQQATFASTLLSEIDDEANDQQMIKWAIVQLAALPAIPASHLITLASSQRPIVRDTALTVLSKFDTGRGIAFLLEALQNNQLAVKALFALRPFLLAVPPQQALTILRAVPWTKVTIAKEIVRLIGELSGEEAYQELLTLDSQELHRDVRVALLSALWYHLERDETWRILEREARSTDIRIALSTVRMSIVLVGMKEYRARDRFRRRLRNFPTTQSFSWLAEWNTLTMTSLSGEHLSPKAQRRLMHLFVRLLDRPEVAVHAAVLSHCTRLASADEEQALLLRLLAALDSDNKDIFTAAARAVWGSCVASDAPFIGQAIEHLLPNRHSLQTVLEVLQEALSAQKRQLLPVVRAVLEALATDPLTIELRIELAIEFLPWDEVATLLEVVAAREELHAGALRRACDEIHKITRGYVLIARSDLKEITRLEQRLATSHDECLRRIALAALIAQTESLQGWDEERCARLQAYRADASVLVRAAAQFTFLP